MNNNLIVVTVYVLANGMDKSWVCDEFIKIVGELHHPHRAAKYALHEMCKMNTQNGWSDAHVAMLLQLFVEYMAQ